MSLQPGTATTVLTPNSPSGASTHLHGRRLALARVLCAVVIVSTVALFIASLPVSLAYYQTVCTTAPCPTDQLTPAKVQALEDLGLSADFYALHAVALFAIFAFTYFAVGIIIFARQSADRLALVAALFLVTFGGATFLESLGILVTVYPALRLPVAILEFIGTVATMLFLYTFPDGHFVPRWTRILAPVWIIFEASRYLFPTVHRTVDTLPGLLSNLLFPIFIGTMIFAQIYRYRHVSNRIQRQQTKWVVFGVTVALVGYFGYVLVLIAVPALQQSMLVDIVGRTAVIALMLFIPLSIGFSILRYRLWDIDLIINRTLVYGALTAFMAGVYSASTSVLEKGFVAVTGARSDAALVLTTLIIVAAFEPVKKRVQAFVDRHFQEGRRPAAELTALGDQVRSVVEVMDARELTRRLLDASVHAFDAQSGTIYLGRDGDWRPVYSVGPALAQAEISVPLESGGVQLGLMALGPRHHDRDYTPQDRATLQQTAALVARAIDLSERAAQPSN